MALVGGGALVREPLRVAVCVVDMTAGWDEGRGRDAVSAAAAVEVAVKESGGTEMRGRWKLYSRLPVILPFSSFTLDSDAIVRHGE